MTLLFRSLPIVLFVCTVRLYAAGPSLQLTPLEPVLAVAGDEALIDCVVVNQSNYTVLWRRVSTGDQGTVLTAGNVRVIGDPRFSVLHNPGHKNWVLKISPAEVSDSGRYSCELNTSPHQRITRLLTVLEDNRQPTHFPLTHNYTDCCMRRGIPQECLGYCTLSGIVTGNHNSPRTCLEFIGTLTQCLTDGRNHMPCCVEQNIPETCRSVCVGDYKLSTITEHYTCMDYTMTTLACIANGVELLPGPPKDLEVEPVSPTEIKIQWAHPHQKTDVTHYRINVTQLKTFDPDLTIPDLKKEESDNSTEKKLDTSLSFSIKVDSNQTSFTLKKLTPLTMYQITVTSENQHGTSLPTYAVRTLTLLEGQAATLNGSDAALPPLPDIRSCCEKKDVKQERCLRTMCDPSKADETTLTDVMICAPWANVTFACMANGVDHTQCCQRRGIPDACLDFCRGTIMRVDYRHFPCLEYMPFYGSCLLEYYGVLPGNPKDVSVPAVHENWALIKWKPPEKLAETVTKYALYWRILGDDYDPYYVVTNVKSPYLLDGLEPGTEYEVFVATENKYGSSEGSVRVIIATKSPVIETTDVPTGYNETECCVNAKLKDLCMPLCTYKMKLSDLQYLGPLCADEMHTLLRCGAGGKDHKPCCERAGVKENCLPICSGNMIPWKDDSSTLFCSRDLGAIITCMEEGKDIIPGMPVEFQATFITSNSVHLLWSPPKGDVNATLYQVRYEEVTGDMPLTEYSKSLNMSVTMAIVDKLKPETKYSFYVVAMNEYGTSTPSLVLLIKTKADGAEATSVKATLSPPYDVDVFHTSVDAIALKWLPPVHVPTDEPLSYIVYYQSANDTQDIKSSVTSVTTSFTSTVLSNLTFNTQYMVAVQAMAAGQKSPLSEVVLAWTDAAIPAFVNLPLIIPVGPILEGSNVTVMCVGVGVPVPMVSAYINGELKAQLPQHHVAVTLLASRNLTKVACFASNGYGQGAHSSLDIRVYSSPEVHAAIDKVHAEVGSTARMICEVSGHPEPRMLWYRDPLLKEPLRQTQNIDLKTTPNLERPVTYESSLVLRRVTLADEGKYFCSAENHHGAKSAMVMLTVTERSKRNTTGCCVDHQVSDECLVACGFDIDIKAAINRPQCIKDLDKLMHCAADGSDHRQCCRNKGVPASCLRWCNGRPVPQSAQCALVAVNEIVSCFEEGKAMLPGPPQNVRVQQMSSNVIEVQWDPPVKNPDVVQWYRVFWRTVGSQSVQKNETRKAPFKLTNIEDGSIYEIVIKAGNHYGLSTNTPPIVVHASSASIKLNETGMGNGAKIAIALIVSALFVVLLGVAGIFLWKKWKLKTPTSGVSFENPTYLKDGINLQNTNASRGTENGGAKPNEPAENGHRNGRPRAVENCYEDLRTVRIQTGPS